MKREKQVNPLFLKIELGQQGLRYINAGLGPSYRAPES